MSKETRKQQKQLRLQKRKARKEAFKKLQDACKNIEKVNLPASAAYQERFKTAWPFVKPVLEFAVSLEITKQGFDKSVTEIIAIGDNMYNNGTNDEQRTEFIKKLDKIWDSVEMVLEILKLATNDKNDKIIDKIIEIGDWIFELD